MARRLPDSLLAICSIQTDSSLLLRRTECCRKRHALQESFSSRLPTATLMALRLTTVPSSWPIPDAIAWRMERRWAHAAAVEEVLAERVAEVLKVEADRRRPQRRQHQPRRRLSLPLAPVPEASQRSTFSWLQRAVFLSWMKRRVWCWRL